MPAMVGYLNHWATAALGITPSSACCCWNGIQDIVGWIGKFQQGRVSTTDEQRGAANADAIDIQRLPHTCGDSSRDYIEGFDSTRIVNYHGYSLEFRNTADCFVHLLCDRLSYCTRDSEPLVRWADTGSQKNCTRPQRILPILR
ncbi:hypothetical protein TNCV_325471 [Trichonephila clavipes]|nr:hypothetical protein TNCV_325471 [Trichonephila clavipes]